MTKPTHDKPNGTNGGAKPAGNGLSGFSAPIWAAPPVREPRRRPRSYTDGQRRFDKSLALWAFATIIGVSLLIGAVAEIILP